MSESHTRTGLMTVDGVRLDYQWNEPGPEGREPIVLLHEGLGSVALWRDFPDRLAERTGRRVFSYSRQGYGRSDPLTAKREPDYMHREAEWVLPAVLRAAGVERALLFGHSDGASIALIFAALHPEMVSGLVLEAPHVFVEPLTVDSIAAAKTTYETTDMRRRLARYHDDADRAFWGWNDIWLDPRFLHWNIEACLPRVECPVLLLQGLQDEYGTAAQLESIRSRTGRTDVVMLDHCGHSPHRDQTEAVLAQATLFLDRLQGAEAA